MTKRFRFGPVAVIACVTALALSPTANPACASSRSSAVGRWDLRVLDPAGAYPSWLEINERNGRLEGRFVGRVGGAHDLTVVRVEGGRIWFELQPQFEQRGTSLRFDGDVHNGWMKGTTTTDAGKTVGWTAQRAPALDRTRPARWGTPIELTDSNDLSAWRPRHAAGEMCWESRDGTLQNLGPCPDLITKREFQDFKLHLEFRMGPGGDSGVHLRGRYEIQLRDPITYNLMETASTTGSLYSFIAAPANAGRPADEWQTLDATLIGRQVTVILNGQTVIENQEIPGITGDALDSEEAKPGPVVLQGYLGPVTFRNIVITPAL